MGDTKCAFHITLNDSVENFPTNLDLFCYSKSRQHGERNERASFDFSFQERFWFYHMKSHFMFNHVFWISNRGEKVGKVIKKYIWPIARVDEPKVHCSRLKLRNPTKTQCLIGKLTTSFDYLRIVGNRYEGIPKMVSLLYETQSRQKNSQVYTVFHESKVIVDTILSQRLFFPSFKKSQLLLRKLVLIAWFGKNLSVWTPRYLSPLAWLIDSCKRSYYTYYYQKTVFSMGNISVLWISLLLSPERNRPPQISLI